MPKVAAAAASQSSTFTFIRDLPLSRPHTPLMEACQGGRRTPRPVDGQTFH